MMNYLPLCRVQSSLFRAASACLKLKGPVGREGLQLAASACGRPQGLPTCSFLFVRNHYYGKKCPKIPPTKPLSFDYGGLPTCSFLFVRNHYYGKKCPKIPPTKPLSFDYGGDLEKSLPELDLSTPRLGYEEIQELDEADSTVKKLVSLEFADSHAIRDKHIEDILSKIQEHPGDTRSLEAKVAWLTVVIRNQIKHCLEFRKDKVGKAQLVGRIQARHKFLNKLRYADYDRFQWICQELKLKYIPHHERCQKKLSKRETRLKIAHDQNKAIIEAKMELFRQQLEKEREVFMKEKEEELEKIEQELKEMGIEETSSLVKTAQALKMGHVLIDEKPKCSRRRQLLAMKFELYKDRRYKNLPEHMKDVFKQRDEQKKRVTQFYRDIRQKKRDAAPALRSALLKDSKVPPGALHSTLENV